MREIRPSGSEGGGGLTASPYPYQTTGSNCSSSSTVANPIDTSAKMSGLIASADSSAALANEAADHPPHCGSFVTRSRMTLLSTSVIIDHFRVRARISSVDILTLDRPLSRRTMASPRLGFVRLADFTM